MAQRLTFPDIWIDTATLDGDGSIGNPLRAAGGAASSNLYAGQTYTYIDDWLSPSQSLVQASGWDNIPIGSIYSLTLAGAGSLFGSTSDTGRLGVADARVKLASATAFVRISTQSGARASMYDFIEYEAVIGLEQLSTLTEADWVDIGVFSLVADARAVFRYDMSNSQGGNPSNLQNWICVNSIGSLQTNRILDGTGGLPNVPAVATVFPNVGMLRFLVRLEPTRSLFYVNGALATIITTNVPGVTEPVGVGIGIEKMVGDVTLMGLFIDYTRATLQLTNPRVP